MRFPCLKKNSSALPCRWLRLLADSLAQKRLAAFAKNMPEIGNVGYKHACKTKHCQNIQQAAFPMEKVPPRFKQYKNQTRAKQHQCQITFFFTTHDTYFKLRFRYCASAKAVQTESRAKLALAMLRCSLLSMAHQSSNFVRLCARLAVYAMNSTIIFTVHILQSFRGSFHCCFRIG